MNTLKPCLMAAALICSSTPGVLAGDGVCDRCGCSACLHRVCVPKRIEKEIIKVCWDYKCEEICIPGRSRKCGVECRQDECGCWSFDVWEPTCARVKSRRVPVKTEVKRKVPAIEWVVEYRCARCSEADGVDAHTPGKKPQPPDPR
jgi:hypothetical protein